MIINDLEFERFESDTILATTLYDVSYCATYVTHVWCFMRIAC